MAILVVGSVAFDSLETPSGKRERVLGGAATHFALAASFFTDVRVVGVVGEDFLPAHEAVLTSKGVDTTGIERAPGLSFHWTGSYVKDLNAADTLATDLNVFAEFSPKIPTSYEDSDYLFLANIDPVLQAQVRSQMPRVKMVAGDTMNYWIGAHRENLLKVLRELDVLLINDGEARMLSGESNGLRAAEKIMELGPKSLIVKHGEYGATAYFSARSFGDGVARRPFRSPTMPLGEVMDPTGAGDSFAGGFYGYIASQKTLTPEVFRTAMFYGSVMGSFAVEQFGTERLQKTTKAEIEERFAHLKEISHL
ncbi:PfkB family carbohydrate kinase [Granulicella mallensis]|uniref:PfkB domain protein n=1 Tax=Granulicella mallensis (strain ATCC BAA-1857 / DSM 23137 / MP5ACTX8) TaxID=682795 RepID=G8NUL6_GRAMM|nr:PfkB family carbohydrate kinase [Granulicella mallensis]AEU36467.1 PfkB domain protein [Granulicella mallensis MP5ACTX8]